MSEKKISQQPTLFAADSPVKMSHLSGKGQGLKAKGLRSGQSSIVSFAKFAPDGLLLKTSQGYSQVTMEGSLQKFYGNFPKSGIMQNGTLYQRQPLEHRIGGIESSSLPTPRAADYKGAVSLKSALGVLKRGFSPNLPEFILIAEQADGQMNPEFHEYLMGFPIGWTELSPQETQ